MAGTGGKRPGAGRKPGAVNKTTLELREAAQKHGPEMLEELARLAKNAESEAARVAAANSILDRAYGKPKQAVEHSGPENGPIEFSDMSDTEIARRIALLLRKKKD
jgi:hypothetical protein